MNEIAEVLNISISELVYFGEKNVFNVSVGNNNGFGILGNVIVNNANKQTLLQRIEKLEKELEALKEKVYIGNMRE